MNDVSTGYWSTLSERFGSGWNRFWFTPAPVAPLAGLRVLVGIAALYLLVSHSADLTRWFGSAGLLPVETVQRITGEAADGGAEPTSYHWSYLNHFTGSGELWVVHVAGICVVAMFTVGLWTRVTSVLTLIVVLSYVHRAPMLTGQFEPVLTMLLCYLALAPSGRLWSVDAWWARRRPASDATGAAKSTASDASVLANISLRLIQVHLAGLYLILALTKLSGTFGAEYDATWWRGEALWWLITRSESRLIDLTMLSSTTGGYVVNLWTHLIVALELAFAIFIWVPLARPLLLVLSAVVWVTLLPVTGLVAYCLLMVVANLAFLPTEYWLRLGARFGGSGASANAAA